MRGRRDRGFSELVGEEERRKIEARKPGSRGTLAWIGAIGLMGWTIALPMVLGIALGRWIDSRGSGPRLFTIMFMIGGLLIGCAMAWSWIWKRLEIDSRGGSGREIGNKTGEAGKAWKAGPGDDDDSGRRGT